MDTIIKAGSEQNWKKNDMVIACNFNMNCNFKCSYCINKSFRKNYSEQLSKEALHNLFSNLPKLNKDFYTFTMAGGEPSLYKYFPEMLNYLKTFFSSNSFKFSIVTNGSLLHKIEEYFKNYQDFNFHINISIHLEQMNIDDYLKIFSSFNYPERSHIRIMLEPGHLNQLTKLTEKAKSFGYKSFLVLPILINQKLSPNYTEEEIDCLKNSSAHSDILLFNEYLNNNQTIKKEFIKRDVTFNPELVNYSGLQCLAGHNSLKILPNGTIHPCHRHKGDPNFNLNTHSLLEYIYIYQPVTCPSTYCGCPGFAALPKWNPEHAEAPGYFLNKPQS